MVSLARSLLAEELLGEIGPAPAGVPVSLSVLEPTAQLLLGLDEQDAPARAAAESVLGFALPGANARNGRDPIAIWQAPDRFLLVSQGQAGATLAEDLSRALAGHAAAVSDVTDGLAVFTIAGPGALRLLGQGTSFALSNLGPGSAVATLFAGLRATLYPAAHELWQLHIKRASARHVWRWLTTAAQALAV